MPEIVGTTSALTRSDRRDHFLARWGYKRNEHRVPPTLYSLGKPDRGSPVFVTANYRLSFDALRSSLVGIDCYILVLNTNGINVWCAAGKGTFGTDELVDRIEASELSAVVDHRVLILPQLGAAGVSAHEVRKRTGFSVEYGPVRASDIQQYMKERRATPRMREVTFTLRERAVLVPIELVGAFWPMLLLSALFLLLGSPVSMLEVIAVVLSGTVLVPILLPWLPGGALSAKGFALGTAVAFPFVYWAFVSSASYPEWARISIALAPALQMSPWVAYLALNFTGATPFTSRTGVRREIFRYVPVIAVAFALGVLIPVLVWMAAGMGWYS